MQSLWLLCLSPLQAGGKCVMIASFLTGCSEALFSCFESLATSDERRSVSEKQEEMEHKKCLRAAWGIRDRLAGVPSGFIMRFKDPVTNKKRYRPQKIWIHSLSRWINIWIVCPRCNWSGPKTYHASFHKGPGTRRQWGPGGSERDSCQPISAP